MKQTLLFITAFFILQTGFAQPYDPGKVNKKAQQYFDQAYERAADGNYANALGLLQLAVKADPRFVDAYLAMGNLYGKMKNYKTSIENYEKAFAIDSNYTLPERLPYSVNLAGIGEFEKALAAVNELLEKRNPTIRSPLKIWANENALMSLRWSMQK